MYISNQDQWIIDSGASKHVTNNFRLLYDRFKIKETMEMLDETTEKCEVKGKVKLLLEKKTIILTDIYYLKESKNIIIITKFMAKGYKFILKEDQFHIIKNKSIIFTSKIKTKHGFVFILE